MLIFFAQNTDEGNYEEIIYKYLRTYIENDITKISSQFYDALKTKNFEYNKILNWRSSQFQT